MVYIVVLPQWMKTPLLVSLIQNTVWNSLSEKEGGWTHDGKGWFQPWSPAWKRRPYLRMCMCVCACVCGVTAGPLASRLVARTILCPPISALVHAGPPNGTCNPLEIEGERIQWSTHLMSGAVLAPVRTTPTGSLQGKGDQSPLMDFEDRAWWDQNSGLTEPLPLGASPASTVYSLVAVGKSPNL